MYNASRFHHRTSLQQAPERNYYCGDHIQSGGHTVVPLSYRVSCLTSLTADYRTQDSLQYNITSLGRSCWQLLADCMRSAMAHLRVLPLSPANAHQSSL